MKRLNVIAVRYPHVLVDNHEDILISDVKGFVSAPCVIQPNNGIYEVVTDDVPPPTEACAV